MVRHSMNPRIVLAQTNKMIIGTRPISVTTVAAEAGVAPPDRTLIRTVPRETLVMPPRIRRPSHRRRPASRQRQLRLRRTAKQTDSPMTRTALVLVRVAAIRNRRLRHSPARATTSLTRASTEAPRERAGWRRRRRDWTAECDQRAICRRGQW